jgi:CoA:oxalate CoA-transferase
MDCLGVGYEALSEVKPSLIYSAISGFGQDGLEKNTPAYDRRIQPTSGIMSITGHAEAFNAPAPARDNSSISPCWTRR